MSFHQFPARFGKYIVLDRISAGGMAEVYRAREVRENGFSPVIAIKRMLPGMANDAAFEPMFVDEAKLASRLVHPNIAQTLELGRIDEALYIAMEMVWGRDLKSVLKACSKRKIQLPVSIACYVVAKAAEALDFAHNASGADGRPLKLVHRDVSPHNVMLSYDGAVKVIDFGIAKAEEKSSQTVHGVIKGKFSYMAPEQVTGAPVDGRTDIFGLGIVLYEALSGERLYEGSSAFSIFDKVVNQPAPRLADVMQVSPELDAIVSKCLAKRREDRFESSAQLADALAPFLIQERSIVGTREVAKLLRELFPNDEAEMRERMQRYDAMSELDCVNVRDDVFGGNENAQTRVFASSAPPTQLQRTLPTADVVIPPGRAGLTGGATGELQRYRPRRGFAIAVGVLALALATGGVIYKVHDVSLTGTGETNITVTPAPPLGPPLPAHVTTSDLPKTPAVGMSFSPQAPADGAGYGQPGRDGTSGDTPSRDSPTADAPGRGAPSRDTPTGDVPGRDASTRDSPTADAPGRGAPSRDAPMGDGADRDASTRDTPPVERKPPPRHAGSKASARSPKTTTTPAASADFGFVSIRARGAGTAKVFIDGHDVGYSPVLGQKLKVGKHIVKVVPYKDEMPGVAATETIEVEKGHLQGSPLRVLVDVK